MTSVSVCGRCVGNCTCVQVCVCAVLCVCTSHVCCTAVQDRCMYVCVCVCVYIACLLYGSAGQVYVCVCLCVLVRLVALYDIVCSVLCFGSPPPLPLVTPPVQMAKPGAPYFYAEFTSGPSLFTNIRGFFPLQFGRCAYVCAS